MTRQYRDEAEPFTDDSHITILGGDRRPEDVLEEGRSELLKAGAVVGIAAAAAALNMALDALRNNRNRRH
mgnify:CR=1 FL=1